MSEKLINVPVLLGAMKEEDLDVAVVASPENFFYASSVRIQTQTLIRDRLAVAIVDAVGDVTLVVCATEHAQTQRYSWVKDIRTYQEFVQSPMHVVADVLHAKGLAGGRIGVEKRYVAAHHFEDLAGQLPNADLRSCDRAFERARMIKTPAEIERLRFAATHSDAAIKAALEAAREGDPEHRLARTMVDSLFASGKGGFRDITWGVATGRNILTTHYWAGEQPLARGEMVRINLRSAYDGYFSHLYRRAVVGAPSARQRDHYQRCREVHLRCFARLKPGAVASELFHAARADMAKLNVEGYGSHIGHSTGIALHEGLRMQPLDHTVLQANMVIASEPMMIDPNETIYHLEDLVLITEDGPELLSNATPTRDIFVIR